MHFRCRLIEKVIADLQNEVSVSTKANVRKTTGMICSAWQNVCSTAVINCWRKSSLVCSTNEVKETAEESTCCIEFPVDLQITATECFLLTSSVNNYNECDEKVTTCRDLTTNYIVGNSMREREDGKKLEVKEEVKVKVMVMIMIGRQALNIVLHDQKRLYCFAEINTFKEFQ